MCLNCQKLQTWAQLNIFQTQMALFFYIMGPSDKAVPAKFFAISVIGYYCYFHPSDLSLLRYCIKHLHTWKFLNEMIENSICISVMFFNLCSPNILQPTRIFKYLYNDIGFTSYTFVDFLFFAAIQLMLWTAHKACLCIPKPDETT